MDMLSTIYLIDDDDSVRSSLARSLEYNNYTVEAFNSGQAFLDVISTNSYGCIILDIAMPDLSGLEVQEELIKRGCRLPIIFMTGHGDVPTSVRAFKSGAIEFLEKPYPLDILFERVEEALRQDELRRSNDALHEQVMQKFQTLTKREVDVMAGLVAGLADRSNKVVARELGISYRTVEEYRARIFSKMEASSITHLVELAKTCGIYRN